MSGLVKGLGYLFTGSSPGQGAAAAAAAQQASAASIAQQRQANAVQDQGSAANAALASMSRAPRGQRLLMSNNDGGLANTLGGSA